MAEDHPGLAVATKRGGAQPAIGRLRHLDRRGWLHWYLFVAVAIITTLGLATTVLTLLGGRVRAIWPWADTDLILLGGLSVAIFLFAAYLTFQQRQVVALRQELVRANEEQAALTVRWYERLVALLNVSRVLGTESNSQTVFDTITGTCLDAFECQQASLLLMQESGSEIILRSVSGFDESASDLAKTQNAGSGLVGWVAQERRPLVLGPDTDLAAFPHIDGNAKRPLSAMIAPIDMRGDLVGVLSVSSSSPAVRYGNEDLQALLLFAASVGICCRHAEQTSWMRQTIQKLDAALQERGYSEEDRAA